MSNNKKNNKKCKDCRQVINLDECKTPVQRYRAEKLDMCLACQKAGFEDWDTKRPHKH